MDPWEAYFYPETIDPATGNGTLRNRFGVRDPHELSAKEYRRTAARQAELESGAVELPRTYDAEHVRAIHGHLFQDVYEWAGQYRTVDMYKGAGGFASIDGGIDRAIAAANQTITGTDWATVSREEFGNRMGEVFTQINYAHPFREGNGRTTKVFLEQVAEQSPYRLDLKAVTPDMWNAVSEATRKDGTLNPRPMQTLFQNVAVQRPTPSRDLKQAEPQKKPQSLSERFQEKLRSRPKPPPKPDIDPPSKKGPKL